MEKFYDWMDGLTQTEYRLLLGAMFFGGVVLITFSLYSVSGAYS